MHIDLNIVTSTDYFNKTDKEIDWDENDKNKISLKQVEAIEKILTTEISIYLLRRSTGGCGSLVDTMVNIRRGFINKYELDYGPYIEYQDY